jgi:16S rRNA (guanine(527)-N(7))-methyltransferase RsmG
MLPEGRASPPEAFREILEARSAACGVSLDPASAETLSRYLALLDVWRRRTNLTGPISPEALADHALESALGADLLPGRLVADIGSGAGFPGVPLAILRPDTRVFPVEPRRKRREFLDTVRTELPLANLGEAASSTASLAPRVFSAAVTRALGGLGEILKKGPLWGPPALLLAWTTDAVALESELESAFRLDSVRDVPGSEKKKIAIFRRLRRPDR